jgi:hypothetical protein
MLRSYFYGAIRFWIMPTVRREYDAIPDPSRHLRHQKAAWIHLHDAPIHPPGGMVDARTSGLQAFHSGHADCRIVAEAEHAGLAQFLTFDEDLIGHLAGRTSVTLTRPSAFWQSLRIAPGASTIFHNDRAPRRQPSRPPALVASLKGTGPFHRGSLSGHSPAQRGPRPTAYQVLAVARSDKSWEFLTPRIARIDWYARQGSNLRPTDSKSVALSN